MSTLLGVLLLAVPLLAPGLARAAAWLKPFPLNLAPASHPSVALDSVGNAIAAWETDPLGSAAVIEGAHHDFGATGFPQLTDFANDSALVPPQPNALPLVVLNRSGTGLVVWVHDFNSMGNHEVQLRTISPGGVIGALQHVSSPAGAYADLAAAVNERGDAVVAWLHDAGNIEAITRQGAAGTFTSPATLDTAANSSAGGPSVAIDKNGNVMALWPSNQTPGELLYKHTTAGGSWPATGAAVFTAGHAFSQPSVSANPDGQVVVAFQDTAGPTSVSAAAGTLSGGFGTVQTLSGPGVSHGPGVNLDDGGAATVAWSTPSAVQFSTAAPGGSFPSPAGARSITPVPTAPSNFELAGNGRGDVIAAWYGFEMPPGHNVVRAAVKPAGSGVFDSSQVISDSTRDTYDARMALDENGDALVGLPLGSSGSPAGVEAVVYDAAPPELGVINGPATVTSNTAAKYSTAQASDAFSATTVRWSFGDGSAPATGLSVSHAFKTAGRFTITATATDGAGNSTSRTLSVTVKTPSTSRRCVVPKLKGKALGQARSALSRAHCKLGRVHRPKKPKHRRLRRLVVKSSSPGAGKVRPAGTKVALTLAEVPKPKHRKK